MPETIIKKLEELGHKKSNLFVFTSLDLSINNNTTPNLKFKKMQSEAKNCLKENNLVCTQEESGDISEGHCIIVLNHGKTVAMIVDPNKKFIKQELPTSTKLWFKHQSQAAECIA